VALWPRISSAKLPGNISTAAKIMIEMMNSVNNPRPRRLSTKKTISHFADILRPDAPCDERFFPSALRGHYPAAGEVQGKISNAFRVLTPARPRPINHGEQTGGAHGRDSQCS